MTQQKETNKQTSDCTMIHAHILYASHAFVADLFFVLKGGLVFYFVWSDGWDAIN